MLAQLGSFSGQAIHVGQGTGRAEVLISVQGDGVICYDALGQVNAVPQASPFRAVEAAISDANWDWQQPQACSGFASWLLSCHEVHLSAQRAALAAI